MATKSVSFLAVCGLLFSCSAGAGADGGRIANGRFAAEGQFPYAVSLQLLGAGQQEGTRGHRCGGALVSLAHVVTAASCLLAAADGSAPAAAQWRAFAGATSLEADGADRVRAALNVTVHPEYSGPPALLHNIAVVTLASPFPAGAVTPLALPRANFEPADLTACTVTGWGGNNVTEQASALQRFAHKYVYNQALCTFIVNSTPYIKNVLPSMVCAVSLDLLSANCNGDEGNPLVCGGTFTGVLSLSDACRVSSLPEVYTRVSNYTAFIRSVSRAPIAASPLPLLLAALVVLACAADRRASSPLRF